jgi:hypothetical protein
VSAHGLRACGGGDPIDGDREASRSPNAGQAATAAAGKARKPTVEELLDAEDDDHLAQGRKRYGLTRDPSRRSPRAVLGIPDDAPLTRQLIRDAFAGRRDAVWGDRDNSSNHEFELLEEARYWLLLEERASEPKPRDNRVSADTLGSVREPVGPATGRPVVRDQQAGIERLGAAQGVAESPDALGNPAELLPCPPPRPTEPSIGGMP